MNTTTSISMELLVFGCSRAYRFFLSLLCCFADSFEMAVLSRMNGEDDAGFFAMKMNVLNLLNGDLGQPSWHQQTSASWNNNFHQQPLVNSSIAQRWPTKDSFYQKRFSINLEGPSEHFHSFYPEENEMRENAIQYAKSMELSAYGVEKMKRKRRLSNLGYLTPSFFDDYAKANRRGSMASIASFAASNHDSNHDGSDDEDSVLSNMSGEIGFDSLGPAVVLSNDRINLTTIDLKETVEAFNESMTRSQRSQQAIHDWDKKMGLKRSHSKTMRLSMRSRKKLKLMIKKDMSLLGSCR
jgi:hypothetical protein